MSETPDINWDNVVKSDAESAPATAVHVKPNPAATKAANLPDLPELIGRLPIKTDTKKAIIQLPEAYDGVQCSAVFANSSVLPDCATPTSDVCRPAVKYARPLNKREFEVEFWGDGEGKVVGPGWTTGAYPGGQPETRFIQTGVPFVEIKVSVSRTIKCGPCDPEKWGTDEWGQP